MAWRAAILTVSDSRSSGEREDTSAQVIRELVEEEIGGKIVDYRVVPDVREEIAAALIDMADVTGAELILTTGGTGLGLRDITPEATRIVIDREVPGLAETMRASSIVKTRRAMLSRGICGTRGSTLIINLPGNPKGVSENLSAVIDVLPHALAILTGREGEHIE